MKEYLIKIDFDLAALSVRSGIDLDLLKKCGLKGGFFFGGESRSYLSGGVKLHGRYGLSGVIKNTESDSPFPESFKDEIGSNMRDSLPNSLVEEEKSGVQRIINRVRKDISNLAEHTLELLK